MSTTTVPEKTSERHEFRIPGLLTIVLAIFGVSLILAFQWAAPTPQFRADAPAIIALGIILATLSATLFVAVRLVRRGALQIRSCPAWGRRIPFDALLCPYCGHQFRP